MKIKTTAKAIKESTPAKYLKRADYCSMHYLLIGESPVAYTCGVYGWNFDAYQIGQYTICTGYRNMPGESVADYETLNKYETAAEKIYNDYKTDYDERIKKINNLLEYLLMGYAFERTPYYIPEVAA